MFWFDIFKSLGNLCPIAQIHRKAKTYLNYNMTAEKFSFQPWKVIQNTKYLISKSEVNLCNWISMIPCRSTYLSWLDGPIMDGANIRGLHILLFLGIHFEHPLALDMCVFSAIICSPGRGWAGGIMNSAASHPPGPAVRAISRGGTPIPGFTINAAVVGTTPSHSPADAFSPCPVSYKINISESYHWKGPKISGPIAPITLLKKP